MGNFKAQDGYTAEQVEALVEAALETGFICEAHLENHLERQEAIDTCVSVMGRIVQTFAAHGQRLELFGEEGGIFPLQ